MPEGCNRPGNLLCTHHSRLLPALFSYVPALLCQNAPDFEPRKPLARPYRALVGLHLSGNATKLACVWAFFRYKQDFILSLISGY